MQNPSTTAHTAAHEDQETTAAAANGEVAAEGAVGGTEAATDVDIDEELFDGDDLDDLEDLDEELEEMMVA